VTEPAGELLDMQPYDDASEVALKAAADVMAGARFAEVACVAGDQGAAFRVTEVADVFVAWLRRLRTVRLTLVAIEEIDTGEIARIPGEGEMTNIDTSQRARYVIDATDDRGFPVDATLAARSSDPAVVTVEILEATTGTASGKDELLATFAGTLGTSTVEVFDAAAPDVVLAADVVVANPGNVATASLGEAVIEEIPVP